MIGLIKTYIGTNKLSLYFWLIIYILLTKIFIQKVYQMSNQIDFINKNNNKDNDNNNINSNNTKRKLKNKNKNKPYKCIGLSEVLKDIDTFLILKQNIFDITFSNDNLI